MLRKLIYKVIIIFISFILIFGMEGCEKEYSYEGQPLTDTLPKPPIDTITKPPTDFPLCTGCNITSSPTSLFWNFKFGTTLLCGTVSNAVINPERNGFTFFGPSACSSDTGLIMTVFLDRDNLNKDLNNVTTNNVTLEYYDNITLKDIFISGRHLISFTVDTYENLTGVARGTFKGEVIHKDGTQRAILAGNFDIQFK